MPFGQSKSKQKRRVTENMMKLILSGLLVISTFAFINQPKTVEAQGKVSSDRTEIPVYIYKIEIGDTLSDIAARYHLTIPELRQANPHIAKRPNDVVKPNEKVQVPTGNETMTGYEKQVLTLLNQERSKGGLSPLKGDYSQLNASARTKAKDMAENNYFSHQSPTLGSPFDQMRSMGVKYSAAGENIAQGQQTPQEVIQAWMNSEGHRKNIMSPEFTHCGVGYVTKGNNWVQQFVKQ